MSQEPMTLEQLQAKLALLEAENQRLAANQKTTKTEGGLKISTKRAVSVYGIGRYPVTLHRQSWKRLFQILEVPVPPKLEAFFARHAEVLDQAEADRNTSKK